MTYNEICGLLNEYDEARSGMHKAYENCKFEEYTEYQSQCIELADQMCNVLDELKFLTLTEEERKEIEED